MSHHASPMQTSCDSVSERRNKLATSSAQFTSEFSNPNLDVLLSEERIQARIKELGAEITRDYAGLNPLLDWRAERRVLFSERFDAGDRYAS